MTQKKKEKISYQEYERLKDKELKQKFRIHFYPWPVLAALLVPLALLIYMMIYYFSGVWHLPE